jgi:hypothetical protein
MPIEYWKRTMTKRNKFAQSSRTMESVTWFPFFLCMLLPVRPSILGVVVGVCWVFDCFIEVHAGQRDQGSLILFLEKEGKKYT